MTDLVTWLRAQLDEDERDAHRRDFHTGVCFQFIDPGGGCSCDHSVFVLADVAAKRAILDLHAVYDNGVGKPDSRYCGCCFHDRGYNADVITSPVWCKSVRLLALPYADRDGYDESWRST